MKVPVSVTDLRADMTNGVVTLEIKFEQYETIAQQLCGN